MIITRLDRTCSLRDAVYKHWQANWWVWLISHEQTIRFNNHTWRSISHNPNVSIDIILANLDKEWDWTGLSMNQGISLLDISGHPELPWDWSSVCLNPNITMGFVLANLDKGISKYWLPTMPKIHIRDILANHNNTKIKWDWHRVSENPTITCEIIATNPGIPWDWKQISAHIGDIREITNHPDKPWHWPWISRNPTLNIAFVLANLDKTWNWLQLSKNPGITMANIEANLELPWDWSTISQNPNLNIQFVLKYYMTEGCGVLFEWHHISANPGITMFDVLANPNLDWHHDWLYMNPNLSIQVLNNNLEQPQPWDWDWLAGNPMNGDRIEFTIRVYYRYLAAYRIQQWWHKLRLDPRHPVCQRRLEREYAELFGPDAL